MCAEQLPQNRENQHNLLIFNGFSKTKAYIYPTEFSCAEQLPAGFKNRATRLLKQSKTAQRNLWPTLIPG